MDRYTIHKVIKTSLAISLYSTNDREKVQKNREEFQNRVGTFCWLIGIYTPAKNQGFGSAFFFCGSGSEKIFSCGSGS